MKTRVLFRGMTSSVGLSAVNQERSDKSVGNSSFCWGAEAPLASQMSLSSWPLHEKPFFFGG